MRYILVTHATGETTDKTIFSGITDKGRADTIEAARLLRNNRQITENLHASRILSSPHTRCVDTMLTFCRALSGYSKENPLAFPKIGFNICTRDELIEDRLTLDLLAQIAGVYSDPVILAGVHNNLYSIFARRYKDQVFHVV